MKFRRRYARRRERGLSYLELVGVLFAITMISTMIGSMLADNARTMKAQSNAEKLRTITETAERYIATYQTDLAAAVAGGGTLAIPVARTCAGCAQPPAPAGFQTLQDAGFLPSSFVDVNSNQQSHALLVQRSPSGGVEAIITTYGGSRMSDEDIGYVSSMIGAAGGGVFSNAAIGPTNQISGVHGGWGDATSNWNASIGGTSVRPSSGTVQVSMDLAGIAGLGGVDQSKYLHRTPQTDATLNGMETDLNMAADGTRHNINNANQVTANLMTANSSMRTPRVYDANNTAYFIDPASTSRVNALNFGPTLMSSRRIDWNSTSGSTAAGVIDGRTEFEGGIVTFKGPGNISFNTSSGAAIFNAPAVFNNDISRNGGSPVRVADDLTVVGTLNSGGSVSTPTVNATTVSATTVSATTLNASQDVNATRDVVANRHVKATYDVTAGRHIHVTYDVNAGRNVLASNLVRGAQIVSTGNATIQGNAAVQGRLDVAQHVGVQGNLDVLGKSTARGEFVMEGAATAKAGLDVIGNADFSNNITVASRVTSNNVKTLRLESDKVIADQLIMMSDRRLKTDIEDLKSADLINDLRPVSFRWKSNGEKSLGFIAQEVEDVAPELVATDAKNGMKAVRYIDLIAPLVAKAQATDAKMEALEERLEILEAAR
ncbi:tail fiber domain-containing protein [Salipiger sp. PrR003]|uniref:tail fiber domain-containing protein n=1 Tax=Salipiger sp. PrR003 TaxID=2706776 RepID=UPI0013DAE95F|nr:tail fiber domain-containing protein [Salipiger sp. PrR003]NDV50165.1 hypothetical protein [Salipiger sp. PrR003]